MSLLDLGLLATLVGGLIVLWDIAISLGVGKGADADELDRDFRAFLGARIVEVPQVDDSESRGRHAMVPEGTVWHPELCEGIFIEGEPAVLLVGG